ncbi:MAG TPA: outer membrane beta-barrel protein [Flavisolibacter sp.]|nr:outer membrane beta-barrel protein [Flavisolibacter sp.]
MLQKFLFAALSLTMLNTSFGQDSASTKTSALSISGSADVYYKYDFGKSKSNNLTSFTNSHNSFELGMASVKFDYTAGKVEMVADLGFGKRAQEFSYNDEGILAAVKQLYMSYSANSWLKLTAGSWATHVGYELVDAYANRNYSMSYMFSNGPFFHTGVKAEITTGKSGFMVGVVNPTDYKYIPDGFINKKFMVAQYSFSAGDVFKTYVNYVGGQGFDTSKSKQIDVVITSQVSNKFSLAFNSTVSNMKNHLGKNEFEANKKWWGAAAYANFDPTEKLGFTLRGEYFSDKNGLKYDGLSGDGSIFATTLSAQLKTDNLIIIPEFRIDAANRSIFTRSNGTATKSASNFLIAAIYQF